MQASKQIGERWTEITGQQEMPFISNWAIRVEELAFYLHLASRLAFMVGGDELRARLQDYLTIRLVNALVDCSFDSSHVDPRRKGELVGKMKMEVLEVVNDAEMEFAECKTMLEPPAIYSTPSGVVLVPDDTDVVGRLAKRIAEDTGQADTKHFRELIGGVNTTACNDLQIIRQVDAAIQSIRN
jgi:hypothetical protein